MNPIDEDLLQAIEDNDIDDVKKAVENGANLGVKNSAGDTPLHVACIKGFLDIAKYLVERGADLLVNDAVDMTPLHLAAREGHDELLAYLLGAIDVLPGHVIDDIILVASRSPYEQNATANLLSQFRKNYSKPEGTCDQNSYACLIAAASHGNVEGLSAALDTGADPDAKDNAGWTALMEACINGQSDIVKLLLNAGVDVNARTSISGTAIFFAAAGGYTDIIEMLLEQGADPEIEITGHNADAGMNAIECARQNGHENIVKIIQDWEKKHLA